MKVLHHSLLLATAVLVVSEVPELMFEDDDGSHCIVTKAGLKLGLNTGCCFEDECTTALADRVTATETAIAENLVAANLAIAALQTEQAAVRSTLETQGTAGTEMRNLVCPPALGANQVHSLSGARTATNGICKYDCATDHHDADTDGTCVCCKVATDCAVGELFDGTACGTNADTTCTPCTNKPDARSTYTTVGTCDFSTLAPTTAPTKNPTASPTIPCAVTDGAPLAWSSTSGSSASGTTVSGNGGGWSSSYAVANNGIPGLGTGVSFKLPQSGGGDEAAVGIECGGFNARAIYSASSCFYWIYRHTHGALYIKEKGTAYDVNPGRSVNWDHDVWSLRLNAGGFVEYLQNGVVFRTAAQKPSLPLLVRADFPGNGVATNIRSTCGS